MSDTNTPTEAKQPETKQHIAPGDKKTGIKLVAPARAEERAGD